IPEEPGTPPPVDRIIEVGGDDQRGVVAERLSEPLVVRTISADGEALSGVTVTWSIEAGGGKAEPASSVSDAEGVATTVWRLGTAAGRHALVAEANPAPPITFEA